MCVFRIGQLGDTLVALPAIHRIAALHPGARLWLITNAPARPGLITAWDVLRHTGLFAGVFFYRSSPRALLTLAWRIRRTRAERVYYLSPPRSAARLRRDRLFLSQLCGLREIAAMPAAGSVTPRDAQGRLRVLPRESERLLGTVERDARGQPGPVRRGALLDPPPSASRRASALLAPFAGRPLIALGPGSKMPAKRWFLPRYEALCRRIVAAHAEVGLVVLGGPEDRAAGDVLQRAVGSERLLNLAGDTDIIESAAVLARCGLYLGNDTGTMHLAASMGVPCVAVFTSRENRDTWLPWGEEHQVLRRELACSGCMLERCEQERMRCLDLISVDDVWQALAARLASLQTRDAHLPVLSCETPP